TPRYVKADPFEGGKQAVAEAWRNLTATGARPLAVTDNLNFGNPEKPPIMGQLVGAIKGIGEACIALDAPVVSGNVSLYNETDGEPILPTPAIGAIGIIDNLDQTATVGFKAEGEAVLLIGGSDTVTEGWLGQSLYLRDIHGVAEGAPPPVDLAQERVTGDAVRGLITAGGVTACHDVSDGGIAIAIAEMALSGDIGVTIDTGTAPTAPWLFGEDQGRYIVTCTTETASDILGAMRNAGLTARQIGTTGGDQVAVAGGASVPLKTLRDLHEGWFPSYMAA
ncbi:MAG: phosphoribosylformylglycinamidine synthase II, partial [Rhodospirillaceae bacterium]|nr:phosphoribosylformylglycinamidine synthase II [Rhodospirillaceae bacterium]